MSRWRRPGAACQRADPRAGPLAGRRRRGGPLASGVAGDGCAAGGVGVPGRRGAAVLAVGGVGVPGRCGGCMRAGSATATRSRGCAGGSSMPTSRSAEQMASAHGPLSYSAEENRQLARELDAYLQAHERPPLLNASISLAVGAASREELEHRVEALRHRYGTVDAAPPARAAARAVPRSPAARGRRHGARLRRRADDRAVRRADGRSGTHQAGSERGVYIGRTLPGGARPVQVRHHRGVADGAAAVDPARRHARVGEDDRGRAARLPGRAPRQRSSSTSTPSPITTSRGCRSSTGACT